MRAAPGVACTACPRYAVASETTCVCPAGYSSAGGGGCTPPAQVSVAVGGGVDPGHAGNFTLVGSNSTPAGAPFPVYARIVPFWPWAPAGTSDVLLTYLPEPRNWALVSTAGALRLVFANAQGQSIALPLGSTLSALAFNATDASAFSTAGTLLVASSGTVSSQSACEKLLVCAFSVYKSLLSLALHCRLHHRCDEFELWHLHHDGVFRHVSDAYGLFDSFADSFRVSDSEFK